MTRNRKPQAVDDKVLREAETRFELSKSRVDKAFAALSTSGHLPRVALEARRALKQHEKSTARCIEILERRKLRRLN